MQTTILLFNLAAVFVLFHTGRGSKLCTWSQRLIPKNATGDITLEVPIVYSYESTTIFAAYEDIQEGQLIVLFLLHRESNVRKDDVEMLSECHHLIPFDDDEGIIHIPGPELRSSSIVSIARSYGLPNGHKDVAPLRPIVSLKETPTYGLAKWLFRRLKFLTAESDTTVSSLAQFLEKLKGDLAIKTIGQSGFLIRIGD
ncbi:hypothetical protein SprV_0602082000 [Sparganum proliferum]